MFRCIGGTYIVIELEMSRPYHNGVRTWQNQPKMIREFDKNRHEPENIASHKRMTTILIPNQHISRQYIRLFEL